MPASECSACLTGCAKRGCPRVERRRAAHSSTLLTYKRVHRQLRVDAVEKVRGILLTRNNRIIGPDFLNRTCAFEAHFESIWLRDHPKIFFSTASVKGCPRDNVGRASGVLQIAADSHLPLRSAALGQQRTTCPL